MKNLLILVIVLLGLSFAAEETVRKDRVLVLIDNLALKNTHSNFLQDLRQTGYNVQVEYINSPTYKLKEFGEFLYDHLILLCLSEPDPKFIKAANILEFYDSGRSLLLAADVDTSKFFRGLINELGFELDEIGSKVYDHVNAVSKRDNSLIGVNNLLNFPGFSSYEKNKILFRGVGLALTKYENFQVWGLLRGNAHSYSIRYNAKGETSIVSAGQDTVLIGALQGRNNARAIVTGSLDLLSNELYEASKGANKQFANELIAWNFGETGLIRARNVYHHLLNEKEVPGEYKLFDDVVYEVDIEEYDAHKKKWQPYKATDLIVEFTMLDPYIRIPLIQQGNTAKYTVSFKVPDKYGVFQYKILYHKPGYTFLDVRTKIPVRPLKHNEHERYLFDASPYYFGVWTTVAGFFVFTVYFLFDSAKTKAKTRDE